MEPSLTASPAPKFPRTPSREFFDAQQGISSAEQGPATTAVQAERSGHYQPEFGANAAAYGVCNCRARGASRRVLKKFSVVRTVARLETSSAHKKGTISVPLFNLPGVPEGAVICSG